MSTDPAAVVDHLLGTARTVSRDVAVALESDPRIGIEQWRVLRRLSPDTTVSMKELGDALGIPAATLTRLVDSLVDRGLVYRTTAPEDRRRIVLVRSPEGTDVCARAEDVVRSAIPIPPVVGSA